LLKKFFKNQPKKRIFDLFLLIFQKILIKQRISRSFDDFKEQVKRKKDIHHK